MTPAALAIWLQLAAHDVKDTHGFAGKPSAALVDAIAEGAVAHPVTGEAQLTAAVLLVLAFRESSYRVEITGDRGRAHGAFQVWTCAPYTCADHDRDPRKQVDVALRILARSMSACPDYPLAVYASGSCANAAGRAISASRIGEARRLVDTVAP